MASQDARDHGTFGGTWTKPTTTNRGHSQRELQDRASFDNQPVTGACSTVIVAAASLTGLVWTLTTLHPLT